MALNPGTHRRPSRHAAGVAVVALPAGSLVSCDAAADKAPSISAPEVSASTPIGDPAEPPGRTVRTSH
ncbi:hypothetical protein [Streptomyces sp. NPDC005538]|uniref:hypothetical protein n=1 Tax=unclassified Streptomyces TaxID=2593676 RepID=UPI0033A64560